MMRFAALALSPALVILAVLVGLFAYVGAGYPLGFIALCVGLALFGGTCAAVTDAYERSVCH